MRVVLIADAYPPMRTSGAVQMRDLANEFALQGHVVTVIVPSMEQRESWTIELVRGVEVLRLRAPNTKGIGYAQRTIRELLLPLIMWRNIRKSPLSSVQWEAAVWYSPTIFLGPLIGKLKRATGCRTYLVLRDIFPEWAVDMGLLRRGLAYRFFKLVEHYQYSIADTIGVQSASNLAYLARRKQSRQSPKLEVLNNWLADGQDIGSTISVANTPISGRTIFVYAGNMGVAQGMDLILQLAGSLKERRDIGFLFVGRGSEVSRLKTTAIGLRLDNVIFVDEVDSTEMPGLLAQCHLGIVALDPRHKTHNVPGKFIAYIQAGLPVLARINAGNDLEDLIKSEFVGHVSIGNSLETLRTLAEKLCDDPSTRELMSVRARKLARRSFSVRSAVNQIVEAVSRS